MKRTFMTVVCALLGGACLAADPGGLPGLVKAKFTGSAFNSTGDVYANALGYTYYPTEMYATSCPEKTTYAWAGYMKMEAGVSYDFKGCYDDYVTVKIAGTWVLSQGSVCAARTGMYIPAATDWFAVEFRVGNHGGKGGLQNSSQYGILWKKASETDWHQVEELDGGKVFKTGQTGLKSLTGTMPRIISSRVRANDPTVLDVVYKVVSGEPTVKVRALAFEDGTRSFWKVVRPETFVDDTAKNLGDAIVPNVEHKLSWKVSSDWKVDLAKVKFEILTSDMAQLPLRKTVIPAADKYPSVTVCTTAQTDTDIFNALMWHYAASAAELSIKDGYLYSGSVLLSNRDAPGSGNRVEALRYLYAKLGYEPVEGGELVSFVRDVFRDQTLFYNSGEQTLAVLTASKPASLYVGEKAYWSVDLTTGAEQYLDSVPLAGWGDEYKTTKLLFRRIEAGSVTVGATKPFTLTKPFYMGVFQVTQKQYELIVGSNPSSYKGDKRPVECVSYNDIRGTTKGAQWPSGAEFDDTSFLGKLKAKVGIAFDLPTEAQWEYACRAGTTSSFNNGALNASDLNLLGRYSSNRSDGRGGYSEHTTVGSYLPNGWGLYDMHGNVFEWCLDWYGGLNGDPATDFAGADSGDYRILRGGYFDCGGSSCTSLNRNCSYPSGRSGNIGFRLLRALAQ